MIDAPHPALELFVCVDDPAQAAATVGAVRDAIVALPARVTLTLVTPDDRSPAPHLHARRRRRAPGRRSARPPPRDRGAHRTGAARPTSISNGATSPTDSIASTPAAAPCPATNASSCSPSCASGSADGDDAAAERYFPSFEHTFTAATRTLRATLAERDPERRLQWNRITISVAPQVGLDRPAVERLARRLGPTTRHLGLEKVVVRVHVRERDAGERAVARPIEIVIADVTGSNLEIHFRQPDTQVVLPRSAYERKVAEARRRRLVYPYEVIRMLTGGNGAAGPPRRQLRGIRPRPRRASSRCGQRRRACVRSECRGDRVRHHLGANRQGA